MFLPARGAEDRVFAGDHNVTDWQRIRGYGLENIVAPGNIAQPPACSYAFHNPTRIFLRRNAAPGLVIGRLLPFNVKELTCFTGCRRSTFKPFRNQPTGRVLGTS